MARLQSHPDAEPALPLLELHGTPRELGRGHGEAARERIAHNVDVYVRRLEREAGVSRAEARERGRRCFAVIERNAPDYADMMRGLAEASAQQLADVGVLNARYELLYSEFARLVLSDEEAGWPLTARSSHTSHRKGSSAHRMARECTAFVAMPDATADGHLRLGQNWDWMPEVQGLLLRVEQPDGLRILCFTEAGIAGGKIGLNSAGLGLAINGLVSDRDAWERLRTPFHVRTWRVLTSRTLADARQAVLGEERSCSANFLIAQADVDGASRALNLETAPDVVRGLPIARGVFAHANHFLEPGLLGISQPLDEHTSTLQRCDRMQHLLEQHRGELDDERLTALLADHEGYPLSICGHASPLWPPDEQYTTVFSTVMDLHARTMFVAAGNPCAEPFTRVRLDG